MSPYILEQLIKFIAHSTNVFYIGYCQTNICLFIIIFNPNYSCRDIYASWFILDVNEIAKIHLLPVILGFNYL
ncbi:hypothetical protein D1872_271190 [compost metagenome]